MFNFFHNLSVGIIPVFIAFTGIFHSNNNNLAITATTTTSGATSTINIESTTTIPVVQTIKTSSQTNTQKQIENTPVAHTTTQSPTMQEQVPQQVQPTGELCNGTYWSKCQSGQNFICPQSGNAYCQSSQVPVQPQQTTSQTPQNQQNSASITDEPPVINGITLPARNYAGSATNFYLTVSNPQENPMNCFVDWGDENALTPMSTSKSTDLRIAQNNVPQEFSHSYSSAGTYTISLIITEQIFNSSSGTYFDGLKTQTTKTIVVQ